MLHGMQRFTIKHIAGAAAVAVAVCIAARVLVVEGFESGASVPALALSLKRHGYRRARLAAQAEGVQFVDAVDGAKLRQQVPGLTRGELGCFYSHVGLWLRLVNGTESAALILEDDANVRLPEQWPAVAAAAEAAPADWEVLYLGHNNQVGHPGIRAPVGDVHGTHAMLVTRKGAARLLDQYGETSGRAADGTHLPVDVWMSRVPGLKRYCVFPPLINPFDLYDSETQRTR